MDQAGQQRFVFIYDRITKGWKQEICSAVAWALIPFDDAPVPPRSLEKKVRKRCRAYAKDIKRNAHDPAASLDLAIAAARDYREFAKEEYSVYFADLYLELLNLALAAKES